MTEEIKKQKHLNTQLVNKVEFKEYIASEAGKELKETKKEKADICKELTELKTLSSVSDIISKATNKTQWANSVR